MSPDLHATAQHTLRWHSRTLYVSVYPNEAGRTAMVRTVRDRELVLYGVLVQWGTAESIVDLDPRLAARVRGVMEVCGG